MSDDDLPKLKIPPDHPSAPKVSDLLCLMWDCNNKVLAAVAANDASEATRCAVARDAVDTELKSVLDDYLSEVGGKPGQAVGLTYDANGHEVVTARPGHTKH